MAWSRKDDTEVTLKRNPKTDGPRRATQRTNMRGLVKLQSWHVADHMDPQPLINADAITVLLQSKLEV